MSTLIRSFCVSLVLTAGAVSMVRAEDSWPVLKTYEGEFRRRIKMPLGGVGTGTVSLNGNGGFVDWAVRNAPAIGFTPTVQDVATGFWLRTEDADGRVSTRLLEGPADTALYEGGEGGRFPNHGFPRFGDCTFKVAYPLAQVELKDRSVPVAATLEAMNPLVPGDSSASGIPAALLRWRLANTTAKRVRASVLGFLVNAAGGTVAKATVATNGLAGVTIGSASDAACDSTLGRLALLAASDAGAVATTTRIADLGWRIRMDRFWKQFAATGKAADLVDPDGPSDYAAVAVSVSLDLAPGETKCVPFVLAWRFPNRAGWSGRGYRDGSVKGPFDPKRSVGNFYATRFASAEAAASALWLDLPALEEKTVAFVRGVLASKAPDVVKEAALFNLSTLRTETCFRTADGHFFGWEGIFDDHGSCFGNCSHVWGYEHALVDLWPDLAKDMTDLQLDYAMDARGHIANRIFLPLDPKNASKDLAAADGQMQCLVKAYENWKKTGDDAWLWKRWPKLKQAMAFCWVEGGWDADRDGLMEGCQHNTMDVEYYGPNPQMEFLYLAGLKATAAMAEACGDGAFAKTCRELAAKGSALAEKTMFNGAWYEHKVRPPKGKIADGLSYGNASNLADPDFQLAAGCLVDQLLGDYAARHVGLGPVADERNAAKAIETILAKCDSDNVGPRYNCGRDYAFPEERALKMAWYPEGRMPKKPFPYYGENMTGFEYVVAANLAQRGDFARAERVVRDIRSRYDGKRRNPFDEAECGHHYARALDAWSVLKAWEKAPASAVAEKTVVRKAVFGPGQQDIHIREICAFAGKAHPKTLVFETAEGDAESEIAARVASFKKAGAEVEAIRMHKAKIDPDEVKRKILAADIIWFGCGVYEWLLNKIDFYYLEDTFKTAYRNGTVLCGNSAGSLAQAYGGYNDFSDGRYDFARGMGIIRAYFVPHFQSKQFSGGFEERLARETDPATPDEAWAVENGAGVFFVNEKPEVRRVVGRGESPTAQAYHYVRRDGRWTKRVVPAVSTVTMLSGWKTYEKNPVLGNAKLGTCFDVNVISNSQLSTFNSQPSTYLMYFSWRPQKAIALVRSADGFAWTQEPEICLKADPTIEWEADDINRSTTVFKDGVWHMWYTGQSRGYKRSVIGYATSKDGVRFTRVTREPVMVPEFPYEKESVMNPYVRWDEARKVWRMWYAAGETYEPNVLCYAESKDGLKWTKDVRNPVFSKGEGLVWDRDRVGGCEVHPLPDGRWAMFYIGYSDMDTARIGCAISKDGVTGWKRLPQDPIVSPDLGTWNGAACYKPSVVRDEEHGRWLLYYNGRNGRPEYVGMAVREGLDLELPAAAPTDTRSILSEYVRRFNAKDNELYTNAFSNARAEEFMLANCPRLACPDKDIERTYYFRWWTFRKHIRKDLGHWTVSEFLPDVGWAGKGNTIVCPAGHHLREGRWLRDPKYLADDVRFWLASPDATHRWGYCSWLFTGTRLLAAATGRDDLVRELLPSAVKYYERWEQGFEHDGWPTPGKFRMGGDGKGGFLSIDNYEGSEFSLGGHGMKPLFASAMWSEAKAIAAAAREAGQADLAAKFEAKAEANRKAFLATCWNDELGFFTTSPSNGIKGTVRELSGYAPWYFGMPTDGRRGDWAQLADANGFAAKYGLSFPERRAKGFKLAYEGHECQWNGPSWPFATSLALTALANDLHASSSPSPSPSPSSSLFASLLGQYAAAHRRTRNLKTEGNYEVVPWIDENMNPDTGDWISRTLLIQRKQAPKERGKDYNHSTFCDLVISGLVGFMPTGDCAFSVDPLFPADWDYLVLDDLRYRGHDVSIRWQRGAGLSVFADGRRIASRPTLGRLDCTLAR